MGGVSPSLFFSVETLIRDELRPALSLAFQAKRAADAAARAAKVAAAAAYYFARWGVAAPSPDAPWFCGETRGRAFDHAMSFTSRSSGWKAMYYLLTRDSCALDYVGSRAQRESVLMEDPPYTVPMHVICWDLFEETVRGVEKGWI